MKNTIRFSFGNALVELNTDYELPETNHMLDPFAWVGKDRESDYIINIICETELCAGLNPGSFIRNIRGKTPGDLLGMAYQASKNVFNVLYNKNQIDLIRDPSVIINCCLLDLISINYNSLILHSSHIQINGYSILFSGKSGAGKSTQAELWNRRFNISVINGDRTLIESKEQNIAYGLPFAGTSEIFVNKSAKLKAILYLEQANENSITKLPDSVAFSLLYPEVSVDRSSAYYSEKAVDLLIRIIQSTDVYLLKCTPDNRAVELTYQKLFEEGGN